MNKMLNKINKVKPDTSYRRNLPQIEATQFEMEKVWDRLSQKENYHIKQVSETTVNDADGVTFVCISDTHSDHQSMHIPPGDVLIHAGDFTRYGLVSEVEEFNSWLGKLPHTHKIVIAGNHELSFDPLKIEECREYMTQVGEVADCSKTVTDIKSLLTNCIYLEDNQVEIFGIKLYGSPWQPRYSDSAFSLNRGEELLRYWEMVPTDTDILVTHSPPLGVGDKCQKHNEDGSTRPFGRSGCQDLIQQVVERIRPRFHIFGHVHEGYGMYKNKETTFINAASCNKKYQAVNKPITFSFQH